MRRLFVAIIAAALVVLAAVVIVRTSWFHSRQLAVEPVPPLPLDTAAAAARLAGALRFRTVSYQDSTQVDAAEFRRFQDYLRTTFPKLHARLGREVTGGISGGFVWGRGAMDDKGNLLALLEAVERLVGAGIAPRRTIYLAFGHDEEVGGRRGAARTA